MILNKYLYTRKNERKKKSNLHDKDNKDNNIEACVKLS